METVVEKLVVVVIGGDVEVGAMMLAERPGDDNEGWKLGEGRKSRREDEQARSEGV